MTWGLLLWTAALQAGIRGAALRHGAVVTQPAAGPSRVGLDASTSGGWNLCARPNHEVSGQGRAPWRIPRVVHHTYKNSSLPWRLSLYRGSWPYVLGGAWNAPGGWSERFWSDDDNRNLIKEHYPWFLETYDSYEEVISKVDAARVFMLHRFGGVYSDMDIEVLKDPAPLFSGDTDLVFFYQNQPRFRDKRTVDPVEEFELSDITNAMMASVPGHPFWLFLAERMMQISKNPPVLTGKYDRRDARIFWTSGPCVLQNALADYQLRDPGAKVAFFPPRLWAPVSYESREEKCQFVLVCAEKYPQAYFMSHWTGTWNHCEVGTCKGDNVTLVTQAPSLLEIAASVQTASESRRKSFESVCL